MEFKELDDAIDAQKRSHGTAFDGRTITVEFVESSRLGKDRCGIQMLARLGLFKSFNYIGQALLVC